MGTHIENSSGKISTRRRYIENRTKELERLFPDHVFEQHPGEAVAAADGARGARTAHDRGPSKNGPFSDDNHSKAGPSGDGPYEPDPYDRDFYDSGPYDSDPYEPDPYDCDPYEPDSYDCGPYDCGPYDSGQVEDGPTEGRQGDLGGTGRRARSSRRDPRTEKLIKYGRGGGRARLIRPRNIAVAVAAVCALLVGAMLTVFKAGASWPASVTVVRAEIARACQNPDVASEPGQVNFACGKTTQQVLWVFALLTSKGNPQFVSAKTGRRGLEPITPAQGGEVAWSLNLHQPYDPSNPIDSLAVAARAINNIVGGATVTGSSGKIVVEPGLESKPSNCARYTGSPAIVSRAGYPSRCALPVTTAAGQAALVSDIYQQWVVGASQVAAQDAGVLFENASDPGNGQVQAILNDPPDSGL
jgi:hypothetical protein